MTAEHDQNFVSIPPSDHVEGLTSVSERVVRKKEQEQRRQGKRKPKQKVSKQLEEESASRDGTDKGDDGHIDFHA